MADLPVEYEPPVEGEVSCPHGVFGHCLECDGPLEMKDGDTISIRYLHDLAAGRIRIQEMKIRNIRGGTIRLGH